MSGGERNHLFLSDQGRQFHDVAGISGVDHAGDSRSFATVDFDRDGWLDLALVNANAPLFQLYRNQVGSGQEGPAKGGIVALRFVGGNRTAGPTSSWSNRDGFGAVVSVTAGGLSLKREHRAGEGFAAQNSATLVVGVGERERADSIVVRWPSGRVQKIENVPAGTLATVHEDPSVSPTGAAFVFEPYKRASPTPLGRLARQEASPRYLRVRAGSKAQPSRLRLYTTMTTWCAACKRELPQTKRLRELFDPSLVEMLGVPLDEDEGAEQLEAYVARYQPGYRLLMDLKPAEVGEVRAAVKEALKLDGFPATIVTDAKGRVLRTIWGVPSASEIQKLLSGS